MFSFSDLEQIAKAIQYTNVRPDLTRDGLIRHVEECAELNVHAAMVAPCWVELAREILSGTGVRVATTLNFPQANDTIEMKASLVPYLRKAGADEFDFPPNPALLLSGLEREYEQEIRVVTSVAHDNGMVVKAMLEFGFLPTAQLRRRAVELACSAGIDWVKQSSGWGAGGIAATVEDVLLMRETITAPTQIKVSGKVNTRQKMEELFRAGATLVGTSSAPAILAGREGDPNDY